MKMVEHKNLGLVEISEACIELQKQNSDPTTIFVEHDGDVKEVSISMIEPNHIAEKIDSAEPTP